MNGKTKKKTEKISKQLKRIYEKNNIFATPLETSEVEITIQELKNKKATSVDDLRTEPIKHFYALTIEWITKLFNNCIHFKVILKPWRYIYT